MGNVRHDDNEGSPDIEKSLAHVSDVSMHVDSVNRELGESPSELLFSRPDMREEKKDVLLSLREVHPPAILCSRSLFVVSLDESKDTSNAGMVDPATNPCTFSAFLLQQRARMLKQRSCVLKQRAFVRNPASAVDKHDTVLRTEMAGREELAHIVMKLRCVHPANRPSHTMRRSGKTFWFSRWFFDSEPQTTPKLVVDDELRLHRDEVQVRKSGTISLGKGMALNADKLVHFDCSENDNL